jgi:ribonuclease-3
MVLAVAEFASLQDILGITFKHPLLLQQSLVHRSYLNEAPDFPLPSNERLEFLGDAVLSFVVAEKLYSDFPHLDEGELTKLRAALVRRDTLARIAQSLNLGDYLYLGRGEERSGGRHRRSNLCGALEALFGAVLLDQGYAGAKDFILRLLAGELEKIRESGVVTDYKSLLQKLAQAELRTIPLYRVVAETGAEHNKTFTVEVCVGDAVLGQGWGKGKRAAEQEAARAALEKMGS